MKKRILSILLALALLCAILPATSLRASAATTSGTCGPNLTWSFDIATGTLTIKGSGEMDNFNSSSAVPWYSLRGSIKKVTIGNSVTSIGGCAFKDCTALTSVTIPSSVTYIGDYAFCDCESLTSVTIPNSVTSIGVGTFSDCTSLTSVTIPNSVTSIGSYAFDSCYSLTNVTIGSSVTSIGDDAFRYCSSLTSVTIPDSVTSIGGYAFSGCTSLTSVTIPESVTSIGYLAFFRCSEDLVIYGAAGSTAETYANDNSISFVAVAVPTITTQPSNASAALGKTVTFRVAAAGFGLSYQWQYKRAGDTSWTNWSGKTEASLVVTAGTNNNGCRYRCVVKNSYGTAASKAATLTVVNKPVIQTQPSNASAALGKTVTFKVVATGSNLTYQWQYKRAGADSWSNWSGKTEASLVVTAGSNNNGCQYRCVVKNSYGSVTSNAATLTVVTKPTITTQPSNASCALGKTVTYKVIATGKSLSYQWQYKRAGATSWTDWSGKTSATLTVTAGSNNNGCRFRCVVKNIAGSVTSNAAQLTITNAKPAIQTQPANASAALGKTATFKVVAAGTGLTYQWQYKRAGASSWTNWSGKTSATLTVTAGSNNNGCRYRCVVKNAYGTVTSSAATLTVK